MRRTHKGVCGCGATIATFARDGHWWQPKWEQHGCTPVSARGHKDGGGALMWGHGIPTRSSKRRNTLRQAGKQMESITKHHNRIVLVQCACNIHEMYKVHVAGSAEQVDLDAPLAKFRRDYGRA